MLTEKEMQDFNATITGAGFDPNDFNVVALADDPQGVEFANTGSVTVDRISTDAAVTFRYGHVAPWLDELEASLKAGDFGPP